MFGKVRFDPLRGRIDELYPLAESIWMEHYTKFYPEEDVRRYMQEYIGRDVIRTEIDKMGFKYFFVETDNKRAGYMAFAKQGEKLKLGKFYLSKEFRGAGIGREMFDFVEKYAKESGVSAITLISARENMDVRAMYTRFGFHEVESEPGEDPENLTMLKTLKD